MMLGNTGHICSNKFPERVRGIEYRLKWTAGLRGEKEPSIRTRGVW